MKKDGRLNTIEVIIILFAAMTILQIIIILATK